jgi:5-formyltetrahydrofolate cyclo-ligase
MTKQRFRKSSLQTLRALSWQKRYIVDKKINRLLYQKVKEQKAQRVMLYIPLELEVNVSPLIARLRREGIVVLVPFMEGKSFRLVKYRLPLKIKKYGVKEPKISRQFRKKRINISIVPIVGTDASLRRIGFGKGMYDRFFMREKRWIEKTIFVQRVLCFSKEIVTDDHDVGADSVITALSS